MLDLGLEVKSERGATSYGCQELVHAKFLHFPKLVSHGGWEDGTVSRIDNEADGLVILREPSLDPVRTMRVKVPPGPHVCEFPPFLRVIHSQTGPFSAKE